MLPDLITSMVAWLLRVQWLPRSCDKGIQGKGNMWQWLAAMELFPGTESIAPSLDIMLIFGGPSI